MRLPQILAMGGGGFTMELRDPALDDHVLELTGLREPRVLFLPTASGDPTAQITAFHARFGGGAARAEHLSLFRLHGDLRALGDVILAQDAIYVGGGSMRNLLAIWRAHRLDELLTEAWRKGVVLAGLSAGAMCWFDGGVTRSSGPPQPMAGMGILPGSLSVHGDGEPERLPVWLDCVQRGVLGGGWAIDDGVALHFRGDQLVRVVSARPGAGALRVDAVAGELVRRRIEPDLLGQGPVAARRVGDDIREMRALYRMRGR